MSYCCFTKYSQPNSETNSNSPTQQFHKISLKMSHVTLYGYCGFLNNTSLQHMSKFFHIIFERRYTKVEESKKKATVEFTNHFTMAQQYQRTSYMYSCTYVKLLSEFYGRK